MMVFSLFCRFQKLPKQLQRSRYFADSKNYHTIAVFSLFFRYPHSCAYSVEDIDAMLAANPDFTHVSVIHHETTAGVPLPKRVKNKIWNCCFA